MNGSDALLRDVGDAIHTLRDTNETRWINLAQRLAVARDAALDATNEPEPLDVERLDKALRAVLLNGKRRRVELWPGDARAIADAYGSAPVDR